MTIPGFKSPLARLLEKQPGLAVKMGAVLSGLVVVTVEEPDLEAVILGLFPQRPVEDVVLFQPGGGHHVILESADVALFPGLHDGFSHGTATPHL